jgi:hypothetical protein
MYVARSNEWLRQAAGWIFQRATSVSAAAVATNSEWQSDNVSRSWWNHQITARSRNHDNGLVWAIIQGCAESRMNRLLFSIVKWSFISIWKSNLETLQGMLFSIAAILRMVHRMLRRSVDPRAAADGNVQLHFFLKYGIPTLVVETIHNA